MGEYVKILEEGLLPVYKASCLYCNTKFEYTIRDITYSSGIYRGEQRCVLNCPLCNTYVRADEFNEAKKESEI